MADAAAEEDTELWLPSEFLTDYHILMDKQILNNNGLRNRLTSNLRLPTEFPFDFAFLGSYSALNSPVDSVLGSTETESDEEGSSLLEIRKSISIPHSNLEKELALSGSSQFLSSPTTPLRVGNADTWDLVAKATGQVARLEMNGYDRRALRTGGLLDQSKSLGARVQPPQPLNNLKSGSYSNRSFIDNFHQVKQQQMREILVNRAEEEWCFQNQLAHCRSGLTVGVSSGGTGFRRPVDPPQPAWTSPQVQNYCPRGNHHHNPMLRHGGFVMGAVPLGVSGSGGGGGGLKKERAGTGVFLPRRYANPLESSKETGCSTVMLPAKVFQTLNKNSQDVNALVQPLHQPRLNVTWVPDYAVPHSDLMMTASNLLLNQHKPLALPDGGMTSEVCLPKEWTY